MTLPVLRLHCRRCKDTALATLRRTICKNGSTLIFWACPDCFVRISENIAHRDLEGVFLNDIPIHEDNRPPWSKCAVEGCNNTVVEEHHFAPRAYFGDAADHWPTAMLCAAHHSEWHRRVTPGLLRDVSRRGKTHAA